VAEAQRAEIATVEDIDLAACNGFRIGRANVAHGDARVDGSTSLPAPETRLRMI
jgi:hypothetical protein